MSGTFEPYVALCPALMALSAFVARSCTSRTQENPEDELYSSDDDEELDEEDDEYWDTDELGIDPEDLYDAADGI